MHYIRSNHYANTNNRFFRPIYWARVGAGPGFSNNGPIFVQIRLAPNRLAAGPLLRA